MTNRFLFLLVPYLLLSTAAFASDPTLHVYFEAGDTMEQITDHDVTLTVTHRDTGKENWVWIYVANHSNTAVNLIPMDISLHQSAPKDEELRMKTEKEIQKSIGRGAFWGQVVAGIGAGLSRNISTARTKDSYGNSIVTTVNTPDYEAQARWLAYADKKVEQGQALTDFHQREWLRANTLFPGSEYAGRLIFIRDKAFVSGYVRFGLDSRVYQFPFPAPKSAHPPETSPDLPTLGSVSLTGTSTMVPSESPSQQPTAANSARKAGVLGISGANWEQGGVRGVEIIGIAPNSSAEIAGLHSGFVIVQVNGQKIRSTQDLARLLAENEPGTKITIGYLFNSNLGWMPTETVAVLTNGN
jgi:hypothetical protein